MTAVCFEQAVDSTALPSLLAASLDLQLVRLVRDAMATPDGVGQPASGLGPAPATIERRFRVAPEPEVLPRQRIEPEPRIEPREVIRPADRFEPSESELVPVPVECYVPCKKAVIEPPWKVLPWEESPPPPPPKIKVVLPRPDMVHKGSLIDFFI